MDYRNLNKIFYIFLTILLPNSVFSQKSTDIGTFSGALFFIGETSNQILNVKPNVLYGIFYRYNKTEYLAVNTSIAVAKISGSDILSTDGAQLQRNYSFEHLITDFNVTFQFNFSSYYPKASEIRIVPFIGTGFGFVLASNLGVFPVQPKIPFATGIKWNLNKKINFALELNYNYTFTDHLDKLYVYDNSAVETRQALKQSAQNYNTDGYFSLQVNLAFVLASQSKYDCNSYH
ncbi:MAG: hypothetical protein KAI79_01925 [Bacteroidales bacterium]|nr:hypothetical protein [Bacteroidales bacterium]